MIRYCTYFMAIDRNWKVIFINNSILCNVIILRSYQKRLQNINFFYLFFCSFINKRAFITTVCHRLISLGLRYNWAINPVERIHHRSSVVSVDFVAEALLTGKTDISKASKTKQQSFSLQFKLREQYPWDGLASKVGSHRVQKNNGIWNLWHLN